MKITTLLRSQVIAALALALLLALFVPALMAQSAGTSSLTGTITDPSGAAIPNVTVTITSNDTGQSRTETTGSDGVYKFTLLPPGSYKVRFAAPGFKTSEVGAVNLNVTETPTLDRALEVGAQSDQVTVEATAETLQTATSSLGTTVESRTVTALPLANRNYTQILGLSAGANVSVSDATQFGKATQDISVNGNDPAQNNFQMDGVAINNIANSGSSNDSGIYAGIGIPNPDAIAEFKIQTSTYDASYGRNPGANVNVLTKSGSNAWHGTAFEFFRNAQLNANDFFYNRSTCPTFTGTCPKQVLNQNQFGGVVGGPIKKDKLFIFGSYQGTRSRNAVAPQGETNGVNLPPIPGGDRSAPGFQAALGAAMCPGNHPGNRFFKTAVGINEIACDGSNISQVGLNILNLKNTNGSYYIPSSGTNNFVLANFSSPAIFREDQVIVNGDYLVSSKNTLAMRYFYSRDPETVPLNGYLPGTPNHAYYANTAAVIKLTTLVTNSLVNELRGSMQRNVAETTDTMPPGATDQALGITPMIPALTKGGINTGPNATEPPFLLLAPFGFANLFGGLNPSFSPTTQMQIADQVSWSRGRHTIRAGFEYEETQWNIVFAGLERGFLIMGGVPDLLLGSNGNILQCLFCTRSGPDGIVHAYRLPNMNSFVQDDWKVNNKLTVNLGVRWEYDGTLSDKYGNLTNPQLQYMVPNSQVPSAPLGTAANYGGWVVPNNYQTSTWGPLPPGVVQSTSSLPIPNHPPYSNFGPRVGFAYQVNSKLVIRGGAGIFYDRVGADRFVHSVEQGNPYAVTLDYAAPASFGFTLANPFPAQPVVGQFAQRWANLTTGANSALNAPFLDAETHTPTVRQYNLTFQYEFAPNWVLEAGYVGSNGINLTDYNHDAYNTSFLASPTAPINGITTNTATNAALRVPYLGWQPTGLQGTAYDLVDSYNSLQTTIRKRFSHGFTLQGSYTYSKSMTNSLVNTANSGDPRNLDQQIGPSYFNRPQRFIFNYGWDLPFGQHTGAAAKALNGWNLSGVTTIQGGAPMTIIDTRGGAAYGIGSGGTIQSGFSRAQLCPGMTYANIPSPGGTEARLSDYFNNAAFCAPPIVPFGDATATGFGNTGPGIILGPGQFNFDVTVQKMTAITERTSLQFRAEFFNLLNHPQFNQPNFGLPTLPNVNSPSFGQITSTSVNPRVIQLGLKLIF
ncbi:MAG TPA: carboxypeptidase-like regulatory domain-containing protein [Bryobacteraceae bacterium]|nr:carboxypeptidase-like regulatory domain-containing protein [Bryobacteraceae bacterium]